MGSIKKLAADLKVYIGLITVIAGTGTAIFVEVDEFMNSESRLNIVIVISMIVLICYNVYRTCKTDQRHEETVKLIESNQVKGEGQFLKMEVSQTYQQYKGKRKLTELERQRIHDLEEERKRLNLNSYTEEMLKNLLSK